MAVDYLSALNKNGSGLNLREIAVDLATAETAPKRNALETRISTSEASISALAKMREQFEALDDTLAIASSGAALSATSSTTAVGIEISNPNQVIERPLMNLNVSQIAQNQVLGFSGFGGYDTTLQGGTITIDFGAWSEDSTTFTANAGRTSETFDISDGTTLSTLAARLNQVSGISAEIIDVGNGTYTLGIATDSGAENAIRIAVAPLNGAASTNLSVLDTTTTNADAQVQAAQNAEFTLNGIAVQRKTNVIDDLIDGVTVTLNSATETTAKLSIVKNEETASIYMAGFIEQMNVINKFLENITSRGAFGSAVGELAGDAGAEAIQRQLRSLMSQGLSGFGDRQIFLSDLGVSTMRNGDYYLDEEKFSAAFAKNPDYFDALMRDGVKSTTPGVTVTGAVAATTLAGSYSFVRDPITGEATLNGQSVTRGDTVDGVTTFTVASGTMAGITIKVKDGVNSADVNVGRSMISQLRAKVDDIMSSNGMIARREQDLQTTIADATDNLATLDTRAVQLESRYIARFAAMETMVSQLNATGDYLSNLIASWNKSN